MFCQNNKFWHRKNMVKCNVLVSIGCGRGLICKNTHCWKNYALCIFQKWLKNTLTQFLVKYFIICFQHSWKMLFEPLAVFFYRKIHKCIQTKYLTDPNEARGWFTLIHSVTHSVILCEKVFTSPPLSNGWRWCFYS